MRRRAFLSILVLVFAVSCGLVPTKIGDIKRDPKLYEGKSVTIKGKVSEANRIPFLDFAFFTVDDGTGSIVVSTKRGLPQDGKTIRVRGTVRSAIALAGRSFGVLIEEEKR